MEAHESIVTRVQALLEQADEFYIPVKHVWKTLVLEGHPINIENLTALLKTRPQFKVYSPQSGLDPGEIAPADLNQELQNNLEALGYYDGDRVSLSGRQPSATDIQNLIQKHLGKMMDALNKAAEACPSADAETQSKLKQLLLRAQDIKLSLSDLIDRDDRTPAA